MQWRQVSASTIVTGIGLSLLIGSQYTTHTTSLIIGLSITLLGLGCFYLTLCHSPE